MESTQTIPVAENCSDAAEMMRPSQAEVYGYIVICGPMCCIGFVLNLLCVAVLGKDKSKVSTSVFLRVLALADNGLLAVVFFTKTLNTAGRQFQNDPIMKSYAEMLSMSIPFVNALSEIVKMYAVLMVVLVTIDRSIAVFLPLQASRVCSLKTAIIEVVVLALYVIGFNVPRFFEFVYVDTWKNCTESFVRELALGELAQSRVYNVVYYLMDSVLNLILPVLMVCCLNIGLVVRLTLARKSRMRMTTSNQRGGNSNTSITLNLVGVATAFVVCETPIAIITIMMAKDIYNETTTFDHNTAHIYADCFQVLGSFINFFIYCLVGRKFRRILRDEVCCCKGPKRLRMSSWNRMGASTSKYSKDSVMTVSVTNF